MITNMPLSNVLLKPKKEKEHTNLIREIHDYVQDELLEYHLLQDELPRMSILVAGSTAIGMIDDNSDVDLLLICHDDAYKKISHRFEKAGLIPKGSDFFVDLHLPCGKTGHYTLHKISSVSKRLEFDDMEWLWTASVAQVFYDKLNVTSMLKKYVPLNPRVLYKLRKKTYIRLRTKAKGLDNPVARGERFPILFFAVEVLKEALRCSMAVEGYPYPYDKWLTRVASQMQVGSKVLKQADDFFDYIKDDATYKPMYEENNPLVKMEKRMRKILLEEFNMRGVKEPWLIEWWKYTEE